MLEQYQPPARSPTNLPDWMTSKAPIIRAQPLTGAVALISLESSACHLSKLLQAACKSSDPGRASLHGVLLSGACSAVLMEDIASGTSNRVPNELREGLMFNSLSAHVTYRAAHGGPNAASAALHPHREEV